MQAFLMMQRFTENSIRSCGAAGMKLISPGPSFLVPIPQSVYIQENASPKDYFTWLLHDEKGTLKLFHISVY